jgi:uncharacterized membrane protein YfcA
VLSLSPALLYTLLLTGGVAVGVAASFTGLGGGFLMVPLLLAAGMSVTDAVGTSFLAILIISLSALLAHSKLAHVDWTLGVLLGVGGAAGAQLGARLLPRVPEGVFRALFALVLVALAARLVLGPDRSREAEAQPAADVPRGWARRLGFVALGVAVGVAAALSGLGGGFVVVPVAILLGLSAARAVGTSFVAILIISVSALFAHARLDHVNLPVGVALGVGGVIGAQLGARLVERVSQRSFRRIFAVLLTLLAGHVLLS